MHQVPDNQGGETYGAGPPSPGARLLTAVSLVRKGNIAADIGCDHGKLSVWLAKKNISPKVIAVDNRPLPLARAKALVKRTGCENIVDCRLGSGLGPLAPMEAKDIIVAGMSGQTIIEILSECGWVKNKELQFIFVPATRQSQLRRWLYQNGFKLACEKPVLDNRRFYTVMSVVYSGEISSPGSLFCEVGLVPQAGGPAAHGYLKDRAAHIAKMLRADLTPSERAGLTQLYKEVIACLE